LSTPTQPPPTWERSRHFVNERRVPSPNWGGVGWGFLVNPHPTSPNMGEESSFRQREKSSLPKLGRGRVGFSCQPPPSLPHAGGGVVISSTREEFPPQTGEAGWGFLVNPHPASPVLGEESSFRQREKSSLPTQPPPCWGRSRHFVNERRVPPHPTSPMLGEEPSFRQREKSSLPKLGRGRVGFSCQPPEIPKSCAEMGQVHGEDGEPAGVATPEG